MSLAAHLVELRKRLLIAVLGVVVGMIVGFVFSEAVIWYLASPLRVLDKKRATELVFSTVSSGFDLQMRIALSIGFIISAPVWMWQIWAFIMPGLTRKEVRYTVWFIGVAIPLFFGGGAVAIYVAPHIIEVMTNFVPKGGVNYFDAGQYFDFIFKLVLVLGVSFVLPLFLVALNLAGVMTGRGILRGWRIAVLVATLFAAIATPGADIFSMLLLAGIMVVLYFAAALVSLLFDRRRAKRDKAAGLLPEAS